MLEEVGVGDGEGGELGEGDSGVEESDFVDVVEEEFSQGGGSGGIVWEVHWGIGEKIYNNN